MLVKMCKHEEIIQLEEEFKKIDTEQTGLISVKQLKDAFKRAEIKVNSSQLNHIIDQVDYHGNHEISYNEFIAATLEGKYFKDENVIMALFNQFDCDHSGLITRDDIVTAMFKLGHEISDDELHTIMLEHDHGKDGAISYDEFKSMFKTPSMEPQPKKKERK